jgi:alanyl-tRNA synthetase
MSTMKAVRIHQYGGPEVLKYEDAPRPEPREDDVLVRVHAAGVNPVDWKAREGHLQKMIPYPLPMIPGWDLSACGGTHTRRTGEVGLVKVLRWEVVRGNVRLEFLCGGRAQRDYAWRTEALVEAARRRTVKDRDLIAHLERAIEEREELNKRVRDLSERLLLREAEALAAAAPAGGVARFDETRPRDELRTLALEALEAGARWVVLGAAGPQPALVLARASALDADLRELLPGLAERTGGEGGGSPSLVSSSATDGAKARAAWEWARERVEGMAGESASRH